MPKIDLMIIGAQKSGTTALKNYLGEHPEVITHQREEFGYFKDDAEFQLGFENRLAFYFDSTSDFDCKKIIAKNVVICESESAIKRLKEHNPDCKLVFVLREPVARAYSSYQMEYFRGLIKKEFNDVIDVIKSGDKNHQMYRLLIKLGIYSTQLEVIYKHFPPNQVRIYLFEDFKQKTPEICQDIFSWLNLQNKNFCPDFSKKHNESGAPKSLLFSRIVRSLTRKNSTTGKLFRFMMPAKIIFNGKKLFEKLNKSDKKLPPMDIDTKKFLKEFYKPHNENLKKLTGLNLNVWEENNPEN